MQARISKDQMVKKKTILIKGKRVVLRNLRVSDANKKYSSWLNDREVNGFLESRFEKWSISKIKNYIKMLDRDRKTVSLAIIHKELGNHIGNIKLGPINLIHGFADIGILIGDKSYWGKGLATEAITLLKKYAFNRLGIHKLTAGAYINNTGSIKAFKRSGFIEEGVRKSHCLYKGRYVDYVLLGVARKRQ